MVVFVVDFYPHSIALLQLHNNHIGPRTISNVLCTGIYSLNDISILYNLCLQPFLRIYQEGNKENVIPWSRTLKHSYVAIICCSHVGQNVIETNHLVIIKTHVTVYICMECHIDCCKIREKIFVNCYFTYFLDLGALVVVNVWWLDLPLPVQSLSITTNVVSSNPAHGEVYLIQHYGLKFVSDLQQVSDFLRFPPPIKLTAPI